MKKHLKIDSPFFQYFAGLSINLLTLLILVNSDVTFNNIQVPENQYSENVWKAADVLGYVYLARNYIDYGVVGYEEIPASDRTIGFPILISIFMKIFGENWLLYFYLLQAFIFALVYPAFTKIIQVIFPENKNLIAAVFLFLLFTGVYFTYTAVLMTDTIFTVLLTVGISLGLYAIVKQNFSYLILQLLIIGIAAQIRPSLFLYTIPNLFILMAAAKKYELLKVKKVKKIVIFSSIFILILSNIPSLRNYINYNIFSPSTVIEDNLFQTHATNILIEENDNETIDEIYSHIDTTKNLNESLDTKLNYAFDIYFKYPLLASILLVKNVSKTLIRNHYADFAHLWGYDFKNKIRVVQTSLKKSSFIFVLTIFLAFIYIILYLFFVLHLLRMFKKKNYLYFFTIIIFVAYFLIPGGFVSEEVRFRQPVEGFIIIFSLYEIQRFLLRKFSFRRNTIVKRA